MTHEPPAAAILVVPPVVALFDGAGSGEHIAMLAAWTLAGLATLVIAETRRRASSPRSRLAAA